jgi:hypothetical protein
MSGINPKDLRQFVVEPICELLASKAGVPHPAFIDDLLIATCAQETRMGVYLHQTGHGPALGIYQMEPATLADLWGNFITGSARFKPAIDACMVPGIDPDDQIIWNLGFATAVARLNYYRVKEPLPKSVDFDSLWHYYKSHWNTDLGAATPAQFRDSLKLTDIRI